VSWPPESISDTVTAVHEQRLNPYHGQR